MISVEEITRIKQEHSLLDVAQGLTELRLKSGEWHGACPLVCKGGDDRFFIYADGDRFHCRQCQETGDVFDLLRLAKGLDFLDAVEYLNNELPGTHTKLSPSKPKPKEPSQWDLTPQEERQRMVDAFHDNLFSDNANDHVFSHSIPDATYGKYHPLGYLMAARMLEYETIVRFRLGWNHQGQYIAGQWMPRGIVIPLTYGSDIVSLKIRTCDSDQPKYKRLGSGQFCMNKQSLQQHKQVLVTEGEFDCMIADQIIGETMAVVSFGSTSDIAKANLPVLTMPHDLVAFALDGDEAGIKTAARFDGANDRFKLIELPDGKDLSDLAVESFDVLKDTVISQMLGGA